MTAPILERIARAMLKADGADLSDDEWAFQMKAYRHLCEQFPSYADGSGMVTSAMKRARAALTALREPDDRMLQAADALDVYPLGSSTPSQVAEFEVKWAAAIDAALQEGQ